MPTIITNGAASARALGFTAGSQGEASLGASLTTTIGANVPYLLGCFSDPAGYIWVNGTESTTNISFITQFNGSTGAVIKSFYVSGVSFWGGCAYYNGYVYWNVGSDVIVFSIGIGPGTQTVNRFTNAAFSNGFRTMKIDSTGNVYMFGNSNNRAAKLNTSFNSSYYYGWVASGPWNLTGVSTVGLDGSMHFTWYDGTSFQTVGATTIGPSGTITSNMGYYNNITMTSVSRTSDKSGNTYTMMTENGRTNNIYIFAETSSSTLIWSRAYTPSGLTFYTGAIGGSCDDQYLYVTAANSGSVACFAVNLSDGTLVWARTYSLLGNYDYAAVGYVGKYPMFLGGRNTNNVNVIAPNTTGGAVGTYGGNVVTNVFSSITVGALNSVSPLFRSGASNTLSTNSPITSTSSTISITGTAPITQSIVVIPT